MLTYPFLGIIGLMNEYGIIVLAAGPSHRLGFPKQLLEIGQESFLKRTLNMAISVSHPVVCVLGYNFNRLQKEVNELDVEVVFNLNWNKGVGSSIKTGFNYIHKHYPHLKGVIFLTIDQPLVGSHLLKKMIDSHKQGHEIVTAFSNEKVYMPVLIDKRYFKDIFKLKDDENLYTLTSAFTIHSIPYENASVDINTELDWTNFFKKYVNDKAS